MSDKFGLAELLAPVGKWDVLEAVVAAGADAVYLGGKKHNMRLLRSDFNFTNEELASVIDYAHARGVKVYITCNNLQNDAELADLEGYLAYLTEIRPDAVIVQDLGVMHLIRKLGDELPIHSSVMANTLNAESILELAAHGVSRVVLGREVTLAQAKRLREETGVEVEYFIHGDMCIAQSGQCFASGILFGESSNRGRCLKPCRWAYRFAEEATGEELATCADGPHLLAIKDMCMLGHVPELMRSGIDSFKIEGRMRSAEYLAGVVAAYRRAIDAYRADPAGYRLNPDEWRQMNESRVRDASTCYAFGNPGAASVGYTGEREPRFFSTGAKERLIEESDLGLSLAEGVADSPAEPSSVVKPAVAPQLAVRVGSFSGVEPALRAGAGLLYVGGEAFDGRSWTIKDLTAAIESGRDAGAKVVVAAPRIAFDREMADLAAQFKALDAVHPDGVLVSSIGQVRLARETIQAPIIGDFGLNTLNAQTVELLADAGVGRVTSQLEATFEQVVSLVRGSSLSVESVVQGPLPAMVLDHCLPAALLSGATKEQTCPRPCDGHSFALIDNHGQKRPVHIDQYCRNHVYLATDVAMLPYLGAFVAAGLAVLRIEGQFYDPEQLAVIVRLYKQGLERAVADPVGYRLGASEWRSLAAVSPRPLGFGAYYRGGCAS